MGSRFIKVSGRLQAESGVIHISADAMEDLTPWLAELSEKAAAIETVARADEVKRPGDDPRRRPPGRLLPPPAALHLPSVEDLSHDTSSVMPKGRNFH
jgi:hypothetical protein